MTFGVPTREELALLDAKYAQIEALRLSRERSEPLPERAVFKALSERFPGALRELDTLPMDVVAKRRQMLGEAIAGGAIAPWMAWMVAYHALLRAALWIKLRTANTPDVPSERIESLVRGVSGEFELDVDVQFVMDVVRPHAGRLNAVVLHRLELVFGVPAVDIRAALFPRRTR